MFYGITWLFDAPNALHNARWEWTRDRLGHEHGARLVMFDAGNARTQCLFQIVPVGVTATCQL